MPGLLSIWTDHLKDKEKKLEFEKYIRNSKELLDRLMEIIDGKLASLDRAETSEDYASPSWPMLQADRIGQVKALKSMRKLLDLREKVQNV